MAKMVTNKKQMEQLVKFMEENVDIAKGICTKTLAKNRWEKISIELNSLGPPTRKWEKWIKVWTDFKFKIKKKKSDNNVEMKATGGGPNKLHTFSHLEETVISLLEINRMVNPPGVEFGQERDEENKENIRQDHSVNEDMDDAELMLNSFMETPQKCIRSNVLVKNSSQKKRQNEKVQERLILLEKQTSAQESFYNDMRIIMNEIKTSTKTTEEYGKKRYYLEKDTKKELLALKREKLSIFKEEVKCQRRDRTIKLKLKQQILELQKELSGSTAFC